MRAKNFGLAAAACLVTISAAACGSSSGKFSSASAAASSSPTSATAPTVSAAAPATSVPATPTTTESAPALFTDPQLLDALLTPSDWGSGWSHTKDFPVAGTSLTGGVDQLPNLDCWTVTDGEGTQIGSLATAQDLEIGPNEDTAHQIADQFVTGDAATMMSELAKKIDDCTTFTHTPKDNSTTYTDKASQKAVSGLGDQAIKTTVYDDSPAWGKDVSVELDVRYGDVVVSVIYDSTDSSRALGYDVAGKVKAIAAKLKLKPTGT